MQDLLYRPLTVKIHNIGASSVDAAIRRSTPMIDACLFQLAYFRNQVLRLENEWPGHRPRARPFRFEEPPSAFQLPLPRVSFEPDLVRFYQRGVAADDAVIQFLSFYHVLEYFFVSVSDEQLYDKLGRRIKDPKFSPTPQQLDRIIQDTLEHKRLSDETEMLKRVLRKFVDETDLLDFIEAYEEYLQDNRLTKKRSVFGETIEIRLQPGHVIGNLAKRLKTIRNALVHSSDRHERKQRYVPGSKSEEFVEKEIPLIQYLAERVIIASAS
jgi:hypothetical protein